MFKNIWTCLLAVSLAGFFPVSFSSAHAEDIGWTGTTKMTVRGIGFYTREGTAVFTNGEEARLVVNGLQMNTSQTDGRAIAEATYSFKDGSGFTLNFVSVYNSEIQRNAGLFTNGVGRFAGMKGSATALGDTKSNMQVVWTGTYECPSK